MPPDGDPWLLRLKRASREPAVTLICVPYAGGNPALFRSWADALDDNVGLVAVRLPGRGSRIKEPSCADWATLLARASAALAPLLDAPHAFFGHSFGGRTAYELAHLAAAEHPGRTVRLFVSGCRSPNRHRRPHLHPLPDAEFRAALRDMGGMPEDLLASEPLMRMLVPAVRSDLRLAELWDDRAATPLDVPLTVLYGRDDPIDPLAAMADWPAFGGRGCELVELPGAHFFVDSHRGLVLDVINERLGTSGATAGGRPRGAGHS
ncbi:thioesterase II family protein [Actinomadura sp. WMMB 499]|uniref:thioesterase II family protein n=1 Tax=Actinomadura sp. WMMB 499 TaxID=1219491 RepID=UPI0012453FE9|nr:alpha/beta fold hydrolase [Actinomadura sp. WMMB 499]QFG21350.1 thioesterase [Actinomadura sp. WMMB 499]